MKRRVKITGIGPVTPAGIGREAFWKGILEPVSRIRPFTVGVDFGPLVAATVDEMELNRFLPTNGWTKRAARHTMFAVVGANLALADAGLDKGELKRRKCAVVTGSCLMDFGGIGRSLDQISKRGVRGVSPQLIYTVGLSGVVETINRALGINGESMVLQSSCCSGLDAVGYAAKMVAEGQADLAICGGTEAPLHRSPILEFRGGGFTPYTDQMPERLSRPFDRWRTTGVISEGACMFVLEPEESLRPGYAYITGWGNGTDDEGILCGGMVVSARSAMALAGIRPGEIDSINAWGPGHKEIDKGEVLAMRAVFGDHLGGMSAVSIKGALGAPLGAAGAMQIGVAALGQRFEIQPPTVNWEFPDPDCDLLLSNRARDIAAQATLINAHGFGSINSAMILQKC